MRICYVSILVILFTCVESSHINIDKIFEILFNEYPPRPKSEHYDQHYRTDELTPVENVERSTYDRNEKESNLRKNYASEKLKGVKRSRPRYPKRVRRLREPKPDLRKGTRPGRNHTHVITTIFCPFFGVMKMKTNVKSQDFEGID